MKKFWNESRQNRSTVIFASVAAMWAVGILPPYKDDAAKEHLETKEQLSDVVLNGRSLNPFKCARLDMFQTKFEGVAKDGRKVEGVVCKGFTETSVRYKAP